MKMKKTYAAALAAAMVLTAGLSAQAADLNFKAEGESYEDNHVHVEGTILAENVAASLEGQNLYDLNDVYANTITTNNGATLNGGTTMNGGATVNGGLKTDEINTATGDSLNINAGHTYVNGDETVGGKLTVNSGADINGGATVNGGAAVNGGLTVDGVNFADVANQADKAEAKADGALKVQGNGVLYNHGTDLTTGINLNTSAIEQEAKDRAQGDAQLQQSIDATQAQVEQNTQKISSFDGRLNSLDSKVSDLGGEIDNVGAISSALAGLHPLDYDGTGSKFQLAAAMGSYDGTQAAAIGGFYHFNEDIMMSVGGATSFGGDNKSAFNVGLSFRVGQGSSGKRVSNDEVLAQLTAMNDKIAALEAENQQLSEKVAALEGGEGAEAAEAE